MLKSIFEVLGKVLLYVLTAASLLLDAYRSVLADPDFLRSYFNSAFYASVALAGTLISIAGVAYAFSRITWPGRDLIFFGRAFGLQLCSPPFPW